MAYVVKRQLDQQSVETYVAGDRLRIGRGTNAELRFDDATVALEHAVIERRVDGWRLTDLGSVTGTYLNGKPVASAPLAPGDTIGIGEFRIQVEPPRPDGTLPLRVAPVVVPADEATASGTQPTAVLAAPSVDFVDAYRLRRRLVTKASVVLLAALAAAVAMLAIPWTGCMTVFQPGPLREQHTQQAGIGPQGCFTCHTPWRGPVATQCSAAGCHPGSAHQAGRVDDPPCSTCHVEHGAGEQVAVRAARQPACVACHRDLRVRGTPRFARRATQFGVDHPELALDQADGRRLPLSDPAARRADRARLRFDHRFHLQPHLRGRPEGPTQLRCGSCHEGGGGATGIAPVSFERHCRACHALTFDNRLPRPRNQAPHADPEAVEAALYRAYGLTPFAGGTVAERRRLLTRRRVGLTVEGVPKKVAIAETTLFRRVCAECHLVDLERSPLPFIAPTAIRAAWLPHAAFEHGSHQSIGCETCHAGARESKDTADVLLPGIAACGGCHGGGQPPAGVKLQRAFDRCADCHRYHPPAMRRQAAAG